MRFEALPLSVNYICSNKTNLAEKIHPPALCSPFGHLPPDVRRIELGAFVIHTQLSRTNCTAHAAQCSGSDRHTLTR